MDDRFLVDEALERCDGDRAFLLELIDMFFQDLPQNIDSIKAALSGENCETVFKTAHSLKSALGNLGAGRAFTKAKELELAGKSNRLQECLTKFAELEKEIEDFRLAVRDKLSV